MSCREEKTKLRFKHVFFTLWLQMLTNTQIRRIRTPQVRGPGVSALKHAAEASCEQNQLLADVLIN